MNPKANGPWEHLDKAYERIEELEKLAHIAKELTDARANAVELAELAIGSLRPYGNATPGSVDKQRQIIADEWINKFGVKQNG